MKRIANHTIVLYRADKRVTVKPGQIADFTDEEIAQLKESDPDALRKPTADSAPVEVKLPDAPAAGGKGGGGRGGNKPKQTAPEGGQAPEHGAPEGSEAGGGGGSEGDL